MRTYRQDITTKGQHSPGYLNYYVQDVLKEINHFTSIADIGCGIGFQSEILKQIYPNCKFIGVDFLKILVNMRIFYTFVHVNITLV